MARPRKVERNEALLLAISAFWRFGYGFLGVRQLERETGINRFMLQTEFGGKEKLFAESLSTYTMLARSQIFSRIYDGGIEEICDFFMQRVDDKQVMESAFGCLAMNSIVEDIPSLAIKHAIDAHLEMVRAAFHSALINEQQLGRLSANINIDESAEYLLSHAIGLNFLIKSQNKNSAGLSAAKGMCHTLRTWKV